VVWIRIRNNPNVLAGSEMKIFAKNQKSNTWKRILYFSIEQFFSLTYRFQNTYESESVSESESEKNNLWIRIRKKWVRIHNTGFISHKCLNYHIGLWSSTVQYWYVGSGCTFT
jgi:hypothetical protein